MLRASGARRGGVRRLARDVCRQFACRPLRQWVTDRNFVEDEMGNLLFWDNPGTQVYNAETCRRFESLYDLLAHVKEIEEATAM